MYRMSNPKTHIIRKENAENPKESRYKHQPFLNVKNLVNLFVCLVFSLVTISQVSAQCENNSLSSKERGKVIGHFFSGDSFGQSFIADASCSSDGNNAFTEFTFWGSGNSPVRYKLEIFEGESVSASKRIYVDDELSSKPANFGTEITLKLSEAVPFQAGSPYTFKLTVTGGNLMVGRASNVVSGGKAYANPVSTTSKNSAAFTGFSSAYDLPFRLGTGSTAQGCGGVEITLLPSSSPNVYKIKVDGSGFPHTLETAQLSVEGGNCTSCPPIAKNAANQQAEWTITDTNGAQPTKIVFTNYTGSCSGTEVILE